MDVGSGLLFVVRAPDRPHQFLELAALLVQGILQMAKQFGMAHTLLGQ
jgi:hypothetical protein